MTEKTYSLLDVTKPIEETAWALQVREHGQPLFEGLTPAQTLAIRCAHADLQGTLQCHEQADYTTHDWDAHRESVHELEDAFPELLHP